MLFSVQRRVSGYLRAADITWEFPQNKGFLLLDPYRCCQGRCTGTQGTLTFGNYHITLTNL